MHDFIENIIELLDRGTSQKQIKLALPETEDSRVQLATEKLKEQGFIKLVPPDQLRNDPIVEKKLNQVWATVQSKNLQLEKTSFLNSTANLCAASLACEKIDVAVLGSTMATSEVIRSGLNFRLNTGLVSSCFILEKPGCETILFGDCGVNIAPTAVQLFEIAKQCLVTWEALSSEKPVFAFLSFSSFGSAPAPQSKLVRDAMQLFKNQYPNVPCIGEVQFDAAWNPEIRTKKCGSASIEGQPNCFIFPDLNSGNIAYKIFQQMGQYHAYGPILQGFSPLIMDLSRGSTTQDIYATALVGCALAARNMDKEEIL